MGFFLQILCYDAAGVLLVLFPAQCERFLQISQITYLHKNSQMAQKVTLLQLNDSHSQLYKICINNVINKITCTVASMFMINLDR